MTKIFGRYKILTFFLGLLLIVSIIVIFCDKNIGGSEAASENTEDTDAFSETSGEDVYITLKDSLTIKKAGTYILSGTLANGQILIDAKSQDTVRLVLDGAVINCDYGAAILAEQCEKVILVFENGSENTVSDNSEYSEEKRNAAIFVKGDLEITGGGKLTVKSKNDGIVSKKTFTVTDGVFDIFTGNGSANAPAHARDNFGGMPGGWGRQPQSETDEEKENSESKKALKAGEKLHITGGNFTVDSEDDAIHSNGDIYIEGGSFNIKTGDDGIHSENSVEITGGEINIPVCYEGIEGITVTIGGGNITVTASDDAINAAGDSTNDIFVRVTGGTLDLYAPGDGIDANGNIFIEGGTLKISGPSQGMEGAIDFDGSMTVTGGEFITAGSVISVSQSSTQPAILVSYTSQQKSGSVISVKDSGGNIVLEYTSKTAFSMSGFTSPSFKIGETYTLFIDGEKKCDVKLDGVVTSISDDGGAYSGGRGGMGGMGGRGGMGDRSGMGDWGGTGDWSGGNPPERPNRGGR